jgi:hypothetical protein
MPIAYKRLYSQKKPLFYVNFDGYTRFDKLFRFSGTGTGQFQIRLWTGTVYISVWRTVDSGSDPE